LTLEESFQEEKDLSEDLGDVKVVYDQGIASFVDGKTVDFHDGPQAGFSITDPGSADKCDGGCC